MTMYRMPRVSRHKKKSHCGDKQKFQSEAVAESFVLSLRKGKKWKDGAVARVYKCNECSLWHWGHISKKTRVE